VASPFPFVGFLDRRHGGDVPCTVKFVDSVVEMFCFSVVYMLETSMLRVTALKLEGRIPAS
jgi:hypothetical protein